MSIKQAGPMVPPGDYQARLTADGSTYTQPLTILMGPRSTGSAADIEATVELQREILTNVSKVSDTVNNIEWLRKQLSDVEEMLGERKGKAALLKSVQDADKKMQAVEYELVSEPLTASDDKYYVSAYKVYYNLLWLNTEVGSGAEMWRVARTTDRPTLCVNCFPDFKLIQAELLALNKILVDHSLLPLDAYLPMDTDSGSHTES
jgi:hypothetical protein